MSSQWYYMRDGQQHGPVSSAELKQLADSGHILPSDLVWKEGMKEWVAARHIKRLFPPEASSPIPSVNPPE